MEARVAKAVGMQARANERLVDVVKKVERGHMMELRLN
jgi:hypothetical protein